MPQNGRLGTQKGSQNGGKKSKNRPKMAPGAPWDPPWAYLALILNLGVPFGAHFGTPKEAKFDQKLTFCQKGCSKKCMFIEFCGKCRFFHFLVDF